MKNSGHSNMEEDDVNNQNSNVRVENNNDNDCSNQDDASDTFANDIFCQ